MDNVPARSPVLLGLTWKAQGDANDYAVLRNGHWLMQIRINGELMLVQQETLLNELIGSAPEVDRGDGKDYRAYAQENLHCDGDLEFDDNAIVSIGDDDGAYVQCWKWVARSALGKEEPQDE